MMENPENFFSLGAVLLTIVSTIIGASFTIIKVASIKGNEEDKNRINELGRSTAVQEEKINSIQSDVKDVKDDVKRLRDQMDELKTLVIKGINSNNKNDKDARDDRSE